MSAPGIDSILGGIEKIADDLLTSEEEGLKASIREQEPAPTTPFRVPPTLAPRERLERLPKSLFVAGWRPFIGWIGGAALAYQFVLYPLLTWIWALGQASGGIPAQSSPPELLDVEALWVVVTGMLGIAGMRSFDKLKKTQTDAIGL